MERCKVLATSDDQLRQIEEYLAAERARVIGSSKRLKFIATGGLTRAQRDRIVGFGARVVDDFSYDPE